MISVTDKRLAALDEAYKSAFGEHIPLMMVPDGETTEGLEEKIKQSLKEGKDLLPDFYKWNDEDLY